ncbi:MAG: iron ABC transporter permease [Ardenticatenaceae bacterium]|nr:iron ABC transporter permease [Ardenticatenaceae bacterium]
MTSLQNKPVPTASKPRWLTRIRFKNGSVLSWTLVFLLGLFIAIPLLQLLVDSLSNGGVQTWQDVLFGRIAPNLLWRPLRNTLFLGTFVAVGTVVLGGYLAWLVVMTNMPGRGLIGSLASIPYIIPSFAIALAWETVFRNDRLGGRVGLLQGLGLQVPDWLAWGAIPVALTLLVHYFSLGFLLISSALATINVELDEAARMTGASRFRVLRDITFSLITPAIVSAALLSFANSVSNFAAPAILGLPVRFETLSTRIFGMIRIGQSERAYVLTIVLIIIAGLILWANSRIGRRRSFTTLTGKGGRYKPQDLGILRWPLFLSALLISIATTVLPLLVLLGSSFSRRTGSFTDGFTPHFWIGLSDPNIAQGQPGILRNPQIVDAAVNTVGLGFLVAFFASAIGILIGYVLVRHKEGRFNGLIGSLSYVPFFIPGIAFGAIYIAQFGRPIGPFPALYGTFALLVLAAVFYNLPFTSQAGRAVMNQIADELEEAAVMGGATFWRRISGITIPLALRGIIAGAVLVFIKMVRDLSMVIILATPTTSVLSVVAFEYASEGFTQFANAITVIIALLSIIVTLAARRWQGAAQPWSES